MTMKQDEKNRQTSRKWLDDDWGKTREIKKTRLGKLSTVRLKWLVIKNEPELFGKKTEPFGEKPLDTKKPLGMTKNTQNE